MKLLVALWLTAGLLTFSHAATNLVGNGDFETVSLSPWTGTNAAVVTAGTNHFCELTGESANLQQVITTTVGTQYYIAADMVTDAFTASHGTLAVRAGVGGATVGSRPPNSNPGPLPTRVGFVFTATTATTNVIFTLAPAGFEDQIECTLTVDNVVVYELVPSRLAGRYSGRLTQKQSLPSPDTTALKFVAATAARVAPNGLITILSAFGVSSGVIFSDGTFEVLGVTPPIKATIKGQRITYMFPTSVGFGGPALTGADASNTSAATITPTTTTTFVLTRVGK
jgi:hypothetical protein